MLEESNKSKIFCVFLDVRISYFAVKYNNTLFKKNNTCQLEYFHISEEKKNIIYGSVKSNTEIIQ